MSNNIAYDLNIQERIPRQTLNGSTSPGAASGEVVAQPLPHQCQTGNCEHLPCLSSNNTDEPEITKENILTPYHRKQAFILNENCKKFIDQNGLENVGFLTLTFPDNVTDHHEAYRRFCNMRKCLLSKFFGEYILVKERQVRGAWHYHLLVNCRGDIRTGVDFNAISRGEYGSASERLRAFWKLLRNKLPLYGFGRSELLPIRSSSEAVSRYVGKYISKHIGSRKHQDKGVRLVSYSSKQVRSSVKLAWNTDGGKEWRRKVKKFAGLTKCYNLEALKKAFGRCWAYNLSTYIEQVDQLTQAEIERIRATYQQRLYGYDPRLENNLDKHHIISNDTLVDLHTGQMLF